MRCLASEITSWNSLLSCVSSVLLRQVVEEHHLRSLDESSHKEKSKTSKQALVRDKHQKQGEFQE